MYYDISNLITAKNISSHFESINENELTDKIYIEMKRKNYDIYGIVMMKILL